jgi:hypothetical protein
MHGATMKITFCTQYFICESKSFALYTKFQMVPQKRGLGGEDGRNFASKSLDILPESGTNTRTCWFEFQYPRHLHEIFSTYAYVTMKNNTVPRIQPW